MSKIELLAYQMRERAKTSDQEIKLLKLPPKEPIIDLSEPLKKIYFHAGRWVGGARDMTARKAFEIYNERENLK